VPTPDVVVIGAGAAGLAAARALTRAGLAVTMLEARRRLGGRIHTLHNPLSPVPVELGAEFIHGRPPEIWNEVESGRLTALEITAPFLHVRDGRVEHGDWEASDRIMDGLTGAPEQSFRDYVESVDAPPAARRAATGYVEGFNAARQERISVRSLALCEEEADAIDGDRNFRPVAGYSALIDLLWRDIDPTRLRLHLATPIERVEWRRGHVRIRAVDGRVFEAPRVVVTLPLGVLQSGAVRVDPEPSLLRAACRLLVMGHAARIVLRFRRPVWEDREELRDAGFLLSGGDFPPTWWTALPARAPVITAWAGGPRAEAAPPEPADWVAPALRSLAGILGTGAEALAPELESWDAHNWSTDPYSRGAYSYVGVGGVEAQEAFGDPVEDTLFFAGEAVASGGHVGTVHAALASGERAAKMIAWAPPPPTS
jgi:monoamine oxidase